MTVKDESPDQTSHRELAPHAGRPVGIQMPYVTTHLQRAINDALPSRYASRDGDDPGHVVHSTARVPKIIRDEAELVLGMMKRAPRVTAEGMRQWLAAIAAVVRNPPDAGALAGTAAIYAEACHDLPAVVLGVGSQRAALATFAWWPAAADVRNLLADHARPWLERERALAAIIRAADGPLGSPDVGAPRPRLTEAEKANVSALVAGFVSDVEQRAAAARKAAGEPDRPKAAYLEGEQLAEARRRAGIRLP